MIILSQNLQQNNLFDSEKGSLNALSLIITSGNWNTAAASTTTPTITTTCTTTRVIKRMSEIRLKGVEIVIV